MSVTGPESKLNLVNTTNDIPLSDEKFLAMLSDTKKQATDEVMLLLNDSSDRLSFLLASLSWEFTSLISTIASGKRNISINANIIKLGEILNLIKWTVNIAKSHPEKIFYWLEDTDSLIHTLLDKNEDKSDLTSTLNLYTHWTIDTQHFLEYLHQYKELTQAACKQAIEKKVLGYAA